MPSLDLTIIHTCIRVKVGYLSLLMSNNSIIVISLDSKSVKHIYKLDFNQLKPKKNRKISFNI
jgi:hypothetical protein